jgi:hypothetical protein
LCSLAGYLDFCPPQKKEKKKKKEGAYTYSSKCEEIKGNFFFKSKEVGILKNRWVMKCQIIKAKISVY